MRTFLRIMALGSVAFMALGAGPAAAVEGAGPPSERRPLVVRKADATAADKAAGVFAVFRQLRPAAGLGTVETALASTGVPRSRGGVTAPRFDRLAAAGALKPATAVAGRN